MLQCSSLWMVPLLVLFASLPTISAQCAGLNLNVSTETILDDNMFGNYSNQMNCVWVITPPAGKSVMLEFLKLHTEPNLDFVNVTIISSSTTFSGINKVAPITAAVGVPVIVSFTSNANNNNFGGFRIRVTFGTSCSTGQMYNSSSCVTCPSGTYRDGSVLQCTVCAQGFTVNSGMTSCTDCGGSPRLIAYGPNASSHAGTGTGASTCIYKKSFFIPPASYGTNNDTWTMGQSRCKAEGGNAATIVSSADQSEVESIRSGNGYSSAYIGLLVGADGDLQWVNNDSVAVTFFTTSSSVYSGVGMLTTGGQWRTSGAGSIMPVICSRIECASSTQFMNLSTGVCENVTICGTAETVQTQATWSSNRVCVPDVAPCQTGVTFESTPPAPAVHRVCTPVAVCNTQYQFISVNATYSTDRVCRNESVCAAGTFKSIPVQAFSDVTCSPLTACGEQCQLDLRKMYRVVHVHVYSSVLLLLTLLLPSPLLSLLSFL